MAGTASQAGDADSSRAPGLTSGLQGSVNVHRGLYCWCHSDSASVLLYFTFVKRLVDYVGMIRKVILEEDDPRRIFSVLAPAPSPLTRQLAAEQKSRFMKKSSREGPGVKSRMCTSVSQA